jgi:hypothetical protein
VKNINKLILGLILMVFVFSGSVKAQCTVNPNTSAYIPTISASDTTNAANTYSIAGSGDGPAQPIFTNGVSNGLSVGYNGATVSFPSSSTEYEISWGGQLLNLSGGTVPSAGWTVSNGSGVVVSEYVYTSNGITQAVFQIAKPNFGTPSGYTVQTVAGPQITFPEYLQLSVSKTILRGKTAYTWSAAISTDGVNFTTFAQAIDPLVTAPTSFIGGLMAFTQDNNANSVAVANWQNITIGDYIGSDGYWDLADASYGTALTNGNIGFGQPTMNSTLTIAMTGAPTWTFSGCTSQQQQTLQTKMNSSTLKVQVGSEIIQTPASLLNGVVINDQDYTYSMTASSMPAIQTITIENLVGGTTGVGNAPVYYSLTAYDSNNVEWDSWCAIATDPSGNKIIFKEEIAVTRYQLTQKTVTATSVVYHNTSWCTAACTPPDRDLPTSVFPLTSTPYTYNYSTGVGPCISTNLPDPLTGQVTHGWQCTPGLDIASQFFDIGTLKFVPIQTLGLYACTKTTPPF